VGEIGDAACTHQSLSLASSHRLGHIEIACLGGAA
jgi:hypothetical protein